MNEKPKTTAPIAGPPTVKPRGLTVYVSGASATRERAAQVIAALRAKGRGIVISVDWPKMMAEEEAKHGQNVPRDRLVEIFDEELTAATVCDVFLFLHPVNVQTVIGWAELGAAHIGHGGRRPVILVSRGPIDGEAAEPHPFARALADRILNCDDDALAFVDGFLAARESAA